MKKEKSFKIGQMVECINDNDMDCITEGIKYLIVKVTDNRIFVIDDDGEISIYLKSRFKRISLVGKVFSALNEEEARQYIGCIVEMANPTEIRNKRKWHKVILEGLRKDSYKNSDFSFIGFVENGERVFEFMRLCEETLKDKKDKGLIEALKKSVQQWQIIYDTGKDKTSVYTFLGGNDPENDCFLCNYVGYNIEDNNTKVCKKCIKWGNTKRCFGLDISLYTRWKEYPSKENTLKVLNHLKDELKRIDV